MLVFELGAHGWRCCDRWALVVLSCADGRRRCYGGAAGSVCGGGGCAVQDVRLGWSDVKMSLVVDMECVDVDDSSSRRRKRRSDDE